MSQMATALPVQNQCHECVPLWASNLCGAIRRASCKCSMASCVFLSSSKADPFSSKASTHRPSRSRACRAISACTHQDGAMKNQSNINHNVTSTTSVIYLKYRTHQITLNNWSGPNLINELSQIMTHQFTHLWKKCVQTCATLPHLINKQPSKASKQHYQHTFFAK